MKNLHEQIFEDIFDMLKGGLFEQEAKKNIRKFIKNKNIEWDNDNKVIRLGRDFEITLTKYKH